MSPGAVPPSAAGDDRPEVPYGEWPSVVSAEVVVAAAVGLSEVVVDGEDLYWAESRPDEGGRIQLVRRAPDGSTQDLLPAGWSARTRVHEYGGGAFTASDGVVVFASWEDQRVHRIDVGSPGSDPGAPVPITPEPPSRHAERYADLHLAGTTVWAVRERHEAGEVHNELVAFPLDGRGAPHVVASGTDFVAAPRVSPSGERLAWYRWLHPDMPWDATELCVAPIVGAGASDPRPGTSTDADTDTDSTPTLGPVEVVAGGPAESAIQPEWLPDGRLGLITDRDGSWQWCTWESGGLVARTEANADIGTPPWVFGMRRVAVPAVPAVPDGPPLAVVAASVDGLDRLGTVPLDATEPSAPKWIDGPWTEIASVVAWGERVVFVGAGPRSEAAIVALDPRTGASEVLRAPRTFDFDDTWFSVPEPRWFPSGPTGERRVHALHYRPTNPTVHAPSDGAPPLVVMIHGGPTAMARARLDLAKQYWTTRGFAVVDVNYGGSTGFGRAYRESLRGSWGIVDVEDCIAVVEGLVAAGDADAARCTIRGGSAGGFTVLAAMAASDVFAAGSSSYGVADLVALATETHKFESRYLDGLIGAYPAQAEIYTARSPLHRVDELDRPLIVFQGLEDEIVPPNQSEVIVDALARRGVPVAYLAFEGEQHGFRRAETVIAVLHAELAFYGRVLGFEPADDLPELEIENLS